jgi:hypothetical protein
MFIYKTWRGYDDGMNMQLPGADDYKSASRQAFLYTTPEQRSANARRAGLKNVDSGHIQDLGRRYCRVGGLATTESGQLAKIRELPKTKAAQREVGRNNVESGHLARISSKGGRKGGLVSGRIAVESGHLASIAASGGRAAGRIVGHNRWHLARNQGNPRCELCSEQSLVIAFA